MSLPGASLCFSNLRNNKRHGWIIPLLPELLRRFFPERSAFVVSLVVGQPGLSGSLLQQRQHLVPILRIYVPGRGVCVSYRDRPPYLPLRHHACRSHYPDSTQRRMRYADVASGHKQVFDVAGNTDTDTVWDRDIC